MVARRRGDEYCFGSGDDERYPKTLGDWVKDFRLKKIQMKRRQRGGNLRICAILTKALMSAEDELRAKQQARFNRWLEMQAQHDYRPSSRSVTTYEGQSTNSDDDEDSAAIKQREEISNLWKSELRSLDEFMRSMSSSGKRNNQSDIGENQSCNKENEAAITSTVCRSIEVSS